ncbi:MAG: hypothetical protein K2X47_07665 [Bdellovibrionales bacterium]|nr:hypothetical protein [Bdellovibrionales bacterium]
MKLSFLSSIVATSLMVAVSANAATKVQVLGMGDGTKYVVLTPEGQQGVRVVIIKDGSAKLMHVGDYAASYSVSLSPGSYSLPNGEVLNVAGVGNNTATLSRSEMQEVDLPGSIPGREVRLLTNPATRADLEMLKAQKSESFKDGKDYEHLALSADGLRLIVQQDIGTLESQYFMIRDGLVTLLEVDSISASNGAYVTFADGSEVTYGGMTQAKFTFPFVPRTSKALRPVFLQHALSAFATLTDAERALLKEALGSDGAGICAGLAL